MCVCVCVCVCAEDAVDLGLVKTGLATLLQKNAMAAIDGIFSQVPSLSLSLSLGVNVPLCQVGGEDERVREKAIEYVSSSLMSMRHILFIPHPQHERHLVIHVKKVCLLFLGTSLSTSLPPSSGAGRCHWRRI